MGGGLTRRRLLAMSGATATWVVACQSAPLTEPAPTATAAAATSAPSAARASGTTLNVRDLGAKGDGVTDDTAAINAAIKAAIAKGPGAVLVVPAGRYVLATATESRGRTVYTKAEPGIDLASGTGGYPIRTHAMVEGATGLTIAGEPGAVLVARDATATALWLERCVDTTVRQIAIDYDPLPFTQGLLTAVDARAGSFDWRVDPGFAAPDTGYLGSVWATGTGSGFGLAFTAGGDPKRAVGRNDGALFLSAVRGLGGGAFRAQATHAVGELVPGDRFVLPVRPPGAGSAMALKLCRSCIVEAVTLHASPVLGFRAEDCDALTFKACVIAPPAGSGRLLSTNADGIHCKSNRKGPLIDGCRFSRQGDDSLTVVQTAHDVFALDSPTELVVNSGLYQLFAPGDRIAVISQATGLTRSEATVQDVRLVRWKDRVARKITVDKPLAGVVSLDFLGLSAPPRDAGTPLDRRNDLVADLDQVGGGFVVRNGVFADHYANGIRVYSVDGLIEGNRFERPAHAAVQIGMDLGFVEVWNGRNITVRGNTFVGSNEPTVGVRSLLGRHDPAPQGLENRNIVIESNTFQGYSGKYQSARGAVTVSNAQDVRIQKNTFAAPDASAAPGTKAVLLDLVRSVVVQDNDIAWNDRAADPIALTSNADRATVTLKDNRTGPG